jgi:TolB-like protein
MTTPAAFTPAFAAWLTISSREAAATFAIAARSSRRAISPTLIDTSPSSLVLPFQSMSGDPGISILPTAWWEDIITALS